MSYCGIFFIVEIKCKRGSYKDKNMNQKLICCTGKSTNLQFMKFIAASMVIFSHAYPIVNGSMEEEPLYRLTKGQISMGGFAVSIFFLSAGYFIAASMERKKSALAFFKARCSRIFPLLWLVVLCSIMGGSLLTTYEFAAYWKQPQTFLYLLNGILLPVHNLPGVFEQVPYLPTVNGALWTLPVEFFCYIVCFLCYKWGILRKKYYFICAIPASALAIIIGLLEKPYPFLMQVYRPCFLFLIGMGYWVYRDTIAVRTAFVFPLSALLAVCFVLGIANWGMFLVFPYLCMSLWFGKVQIAKQVARIGDISYGMYLCGFPVQQVLVLHYGKQLSIGVHSMLAIMVTCVLGMCLTKIENKLKNN